MSGIRQNFPDLPPIWAVAFAIGAVVAGRLLPPGAFSSPTLHAIGIGLILAGAVLAAWAALWFRRKRTTIEPRDKPSRLIVEGPFRINRNPIYTGFALAIFGVACLWGGPFGLVVAACFPIVITRRFILAEEGALRDAFGAEAERYFAQSRRW